MLIFILWKTHLTCKDKTANATYVMNCMANFTQALQEKGFTICQYVIDPFIVCYCDLH